MSDMVRTSSCRASRPRCTRSTGALWWLADLAARQGLVETFTGADDLEDLYDRLHEGDPGTAWLAEFDAFLEKYGRRSTAAIFDPYYTTWLEDPYPALATILTYVRKGGFDFESHARRLIEERDRAIGETVARIDEAAERAVFLRALQDAQNTYPFNEDHNFYVEQWMYSELRYVIHECGRRLLALGVIGEDGCDPYGPAGGEPREGLAGDPDDVFFLTSR